MSGIYNLGDRAITAVLTNEVITAGVSSSGVDQELVDGLDWMAAVTLFCNFTWGSGGSTVTVYVETTLDEVNWIQIARFDFTISSDAKRCNLSGLTPVGVASVGTLSANSVLDGILGDRLRARVTTTGVYAGNTAIAVRASVR